MPTKNSQDNEEKPVVKNENLVRAIDLRDLPRKVRIPGSLSDDEISLGEVAETLNQLIEFLEVRHGRN